MAEMQDINVKVSAEVIHEIEVEMKALEESAVIPYQAKRSDAGYDLIATQDAMVYAGQREAVATGISVAIPEGYAGFIWPRSGMALRDGIDVLGGVIDSGYRGEVKVILQNHGGHSFLVNEGDRIAQLVIQPVASVTFTEVPALPDTERAAGGFGSTGRAVL